MWVSPLNVADDTGPGSVVSITITDAGAGYGSTAPMVTLSKPDESISTQAIAKAILTNASISGVSGIGYTKAPTVTIIPADGMTPSHDCSKALSRHSKLCPATSVPSIRGPSQQPL